MPGHPGQRAVRPRLAVAILSLSSVACGADRATGGTGDADTVPASLSVVSGDQQSAWITQSLAHPLVVRVANASGAALARVAVTWAVTAGGGVLHPATSATGASGVAEASLALGPLAGAENNVVTATVGTLSPVTFRASGVGWRALSAGNYHTCAITTTGAAWCWGPNYYGELGTGDLAARTEPAPVATSRTFVQLSAGSAHTCGVTSASEVLCWGYNRLGQLGDGSVMDRTSPVPLVGAPALASVAAGQNHTCGLTQAGRAYCWGGNSYGQLGLGDTLPRAGVVAVSGGIVFVSLAAGMAHTCGLTVAGVAYCWGATVGLWGPRVTTPGLVPGGRVFSRISAGTNRTCAADLANAAYCWGANDFGELGDGTQVWSATPVAVGGGIGFILTSTGGFHSCGLTPAGAAWCWGWGAFGQMGNGGFSLVSTTPVAVSGGIAFDSLVTGGDHSCALSGSGVAYCWGENTRAALGDGTKLNRAVPTRVSMP